MKGAGGRGRGEGGGARVSRVAYLCIQSNVYFISLYESPMCLNNRALCDFEQNAPIKEHWTI